VKRKPEPETERLDDAARAGWLYYIAGNTQDEIARKLGVSRQSAQRLVSLAISEKLIKVRLDHPLANCLELAKRLRDRFELNMVEVVPADPQSTSNTLGIVGAAAAELERCLDSQHPVIAAVGTGRTLRAMAEQVSPMDCPQHKIVAIVGNIAPDGSATIFDVASRIGDRVRAPYYPMPLPLMATTVPERNLLLSQKSIRNIADLAEQADITFVGIGTVDAEAAVLRDGFMRPEEVRSLVRSGAVGEITGWAFDGNGDLIEGLTNDRVLSVPLQKPAKGRVIGVSMALSRLKAIRGALKGRLVNGLITNETMAAALLEK
jgi:DNA-binding transcriptional regulator LsrR (DeoR family)